MAHTITNRDDVIDSRDIIERIEELEGERETLSDNVDEKLGVLEELKTGPEDDGEEAAQAHQEKLDAAEGEHNDAIAELDDWDAENGDELKSLQTLSDEGEDYSSEWSDGATLIRDDYFEEYAQQLCEDIGDLPRNIPSYIEIDWAATASNIQQDYTSVDYDGVTYWVR